MLEFFLLFLRRICNYNSVYLTNNLVESVFCCDKATVVPTLDRKQRAMSCQKALFTAGNALGICRNTYSVLIFNSSENKSNE